MIERLLLLLVSAQVPGPPIPTPIFPTRESVIPQGTAACRGFSVRFEWSVPQPLDIWEYQIKVLAPGTRIYAVDLLVPGQSFVWDQCQNGMGREALTGWTWRVRARDRARQWGLWTPAVTFSFGHAGR